MTNASNIPSAIRATVDKLAATKALIADLKITEDALKADLIDSGYSAIDGDRFRATVTQSDGRTVIDWKAVAERLNPSRQLVQAHTSQGDAFFTVRVVARKTS